MAGTEINVAPKYVLQGNNKDNVGKKKNPYLLIMDNIETALAIKVDKIRRNPSGAIVYSLV